MTQSFWVFCHVFSELMSILNLLITLQKSAKGRNSSIDPQTTSGKCQCDRLIGYDIDRISCETRVIRFCFFAWYVLVLLRKNPWLCLQSCRKQLTSCFKWVLYQTMDGSVLANFPKIIEMVVGHHWYIVNTTTLPPSLVSDTCHGNSNQASAIVKDMAAYFLEDLGVSLWQRIR